MKFNTFSGFLFIFLFCILGNFSANAQMPALKNYNVEQGLPSSETYRVLQDSKGYIWAATDGGVARFDGNSIKTYTTKDGLCDNSILHMYEDSKKRVWFYSFSGKFSYYFNDSIYNIAANNTDLNYLLKGANFNSMYVDENDTLWVKNKYNILIKASIYSKIYSYQDALLYAISITEIDNKGFVFGLQPNKTTSYCIQHKYKNGTIHQFNFPKLYRPDFNMFNKQSLKVIRLSDGSFLLSLYTCLLRIKDDVIIEETTTKKPILSLYEDKEKNIWVGLRFGGAQCYKLDNKKYFSKKPKQCIEYRSVTSIFQDLEGAFWFSTLESGIYYFPSLYFKSYILKNLQNDYKIVDLCHVKDDEFLFATYNNELFLINEDSIYKKNLKVKNNLAVYEHIFNDENNNLWLAATDNISWNGLIKSDLNLNNLHPYHIGSPLSFYKDGNDLWFGASGLMKLSMNDNNIKDYTDLKTYLKGVVKIRISSICKRGDTLFLATTNGLWGFINEKFVYLGNSNPLLKNRITDIKKDNQGNLLLATKGAGMLVYTVKGNILQISEKDGLANDLCNSLAIENNEIIWVGTNNGLSKITTAGLKYTNYKIFNYNTTHGLVSNQVNKVLTNNDKVWVCTTPGITSFSPKNITTNNISTPVYISEAFSNNKKVKVSANYLFSYKENTIEFHYVGLAFKNATNIRYKYQLEGLDTAHIFTYNTSVRFSDLQYGKYVFRVYASNNDGIWSATPALVSFTITPAFYQTIWFIVAIIFTAIIIIILIMFLIIKRVREKAFLIQQAAEAKQQTLLSQMNPHFIFNSLNSIQRFMMNNDKVMFSNYLSKFANLMRSILENSQSLNISLEEEIHSLTLYLELESLRFENKFTYSINIDKGINVYDTEVPSTLFQPYIENAIKHGLVSPEIKGHIDLEIKKQNDGIVVLITDNGVGREKAAENKIVNHRSLGTKITQERISTINSYRKSKITIAIIDLYSDSNQATGTRIELFIPKN